MMHRFATLTGVTALAAAGIVAAGSSAQAAAAPAHASPRTPITCSLTPVTPTILHGSPNNVEGIASILCSAIVPQISIEVLLFENGNEVSYSYTTVSNSSTAVVVTLAPDSQATYQDAAYGSVTFPAGSSPATQVFPITYSPTVFLH